MSECVNFALKYDIQSLVDTAVAFLIRRLNGDNVSEYLKLSAKYGIQVLKDAIVNFLVQHQDVDNATKYLALAKKHDMVEVKIAAEHLLAPIADIQVNANENLKTSNLKQVRCGQVIDAFDIISLRLFSQKMYES